MNILEPFIWFSKFLWEHVLISRTIAIYILQFALKWAVSKKSKEDFLELFAQSGQDVTFIGFSFIIISMLTKSSRLYAKLDATSKDPICLTWILITFIFLYILLSIIVIIFNTIRKESSDFEKMFFGKIPKKRFFEITSYFIGLFALTLSLECL